MSKVVGVTSGKIYMDGQCRGVDASFVGSFVWPGTRCTTDNI